MTSMDMPQVGTVAVNCASFTAGGYDTVANTDYQDLAVFGSGDTLPWAVSNWTISRGSPAKTTVISEEEDMADQESKRLVIVAIVDPHPDVPVEDSTVYLDMNPKLTDQTDQELFMALNIGEVLAAHNERRTKCLANRRRGWLHATCFSNQHASAISVWPSSPWQCSSPDVLATRAGMERKQT